jgi:hypothetical protein
MKATNKVRKTLWLREDELLEEHCCAVVSLGRALVPFRSRGLGRLMGWIER